MERTGLDTYYSLRVLADLDGTGAKWWDDIAVYNSSSAKADILNFNKDTGAFDWQPNNWDTLNSYTFQLSHHDANGSTDVKSFTLTVTNVAPTLTVPAGWDLFEDDTDQYGNATGAQAGHPETFYKIPGDRINSDQEGLDLYYKLWITDLHGTKTEWTAPFAPNTGGGVVDFNGDTGEIVWHTNNADVSVDIDDTGAILHTDAYTFTIQAWDNRGGHSAEQDIAVKVFNTATQLPAIADRTFNENGRMDVTDTMVAAIDERLGPDSHYTLSIQRDGDPGFQDVNAYNANNGFGSDISFDESTGAITWSANNRDVGHYTFQVIHYDGHGSDDTQSFQVTVVNVDPVFTSPAPDGQVIPVTKTFSYDPSTDQEGLHDWRGDDRVTYSLVEAPKSMTIDATSGLVEWVAEPVVGGKVSVTIRVDDGNGGFALQSFTIISDLPTNELPIEMRPTISSLELSQSPVEEGPLYGGTHPTLPHDVGPITHSGGTVHQGGPAPIGSPEQELGGGPEGHNLQQPELGHAGSEPPITPLNLYAPEVVKGKRLHFNAEEVQLWDAFDLKQPTLAVAGSQGPHTPLEGYALAVDLGSRLNFNYRPITDALSIKMDDMRVSDLLGL